MVSSTVPTVIRCQIIPATESSGFVTPSRDVEGVPPRVRGSYGGVVSEGKAASHGDPALTADLDRGAA